MMDYVINVGGYIGDSTRSEIDYAKNMERKYVTWNRIITFNVIFNLGEC